jgi:hypothetical protein
VFLFSIFFLVVFDLLVLYVSLFCVGCAVIFLMTVGCCYGGLFCGVDIYVINIFNEFIEDPHVLTYSCQCRHAYICLLLVTYQVILRYVNVEFLHK